MTLHDSNYWQQQTDLADEIRPIVERAFAFAWTAGHVQATEAGTWQYIGDEYTLIYDPHSDEIAIQSKESAWQVAYHEGGFVPQTNIEISALQMQEFRALSDFFDEREIPAIIALRDLTTSIDTRGSAAQLFEQYVALGSEAYKDSPESDEWKYRVEVDGAVFVVSRDDSTGDVALGKENGNITALDLQTIDAVIAFNTVPMASADLAPDWSRPTWEEQCDFANRILPIGEALWRDREQQGNFMWDAPTQSYVAPLFDEFSGGYVPETDTFWIAPDEATQLVSAADWTRHYDLDHNTWMLRGLDHLGSITPEDVDRFQSAQIWRQVRRQFEPEVESLQVPSRIDDRRNESWFSSLVPDTAAEVEHQVLPKPELEKQPQTQISHIAVQPSAEIDRD